MAIPLTILMNDDTMTRIESYCVPRFDPLLASWQLWQDLGKLVLHLGNHGSHGKTLTEILLRYHIPRSYLITMDKILRL